jgi:hypothetical protein
MPDISTDTASHPKTIEPSGGGRWTAPMTTPDLTDRPMQAPARRFQRCGTRWLRPFGVVREWLVKHVGITEAGRPVERLR